MTAAAEAVAAFAEPTRRWFESTFDGPTGAQIGAWPAIASGDHTLVAAPTGSGKTLAAFLTAIDGLVADALRGELQDETRVVYVSPLKALGNDVEKNLRAPLAGILEEAGLPAETIRTAVRSGDTPASERRSQLARPVHIFVTTPESLYILLTSEGGRRMLRTVRTLIVDEIHAVVGDKRGSHLALTVERLERLADTPLQRIGLSATQRPIESVAHFLVGGPSPASSAACTIVDTGHRREMDLRVEVPESPLSAVMSAEVWTEVHRRLSDLVAEHATTLIFVNTRRLAERLTAHLEELVGEGSVMSHHGSLSRKHRLAAEQRLKNGELRALVATASLELGIDIGDVDLVCQIGPTRSIASLLQRVGRSGHAVGLIPKGRLFPLTRDELIECAALLASVREGELDVLEFPERPLDILGQQIVAEVAGDEYGEDELFETVRRAWPYRDLDRSEFDDVVRMLAEGFSTRRGRRGAYIHHDAVNRRVRARRGARITAMTSGGAIPDVADYDVVLESTGLRIGSVDEDFAVESMVGDVFQLGNNSWQVLKVEPGKVFVSDATGMQPTVPFWFGEAPPRSRELSAAVARLRDEVARRLEAGGAAGAAAWLEAECGLSAAAAEQAAEYLAAGMAALGAMPTQTTVVLERFFDESGGTQLVVHSPFGARVNRAWGLALRKRFCRRFNFELQAAATEDAIVLSLGATHSFKLDEVLDYLAPESVRQVLVQALLDAPMFGTRWRWNANRSLAIPRFRGGKRVPAAIQRINAEDLVSVVFPDQIACQENIVGEREIPDHPLVRQTIRDCLEEAMDIDALERLLNALRDGSIRAVTAELTEPSPLAAEIINAAPYAFLDDAPLEERRTNAVRSRRWMDAADAADLGRLDPQAAAAVRSGAWPVVRDVDELHDALMVAGVLAPDIDRVLQEDEPFETAPLVREVWGSWFAELRATQRAVECEVLPGHAVWTAVERLPEVRSAYGDAALGGEATVPGRFDDQVPADRAALELVRSRLEVSGPVSESSLAAVLGASETAFGQESGPPDGAGETTFGQVVETFGQVVEQSGETTFGQESGPPDGAGETTFGQVVETFGQVVEQSGETTFGQESGPPDRAGETTFGQVRSRGVAGVAAALAALEVEGFAMRGDFLGEGESWCERGLLARIHRLTLDRLRSRVQPVAPVVFVRHMLHVQRLTPEEQAEGIEGLMGVVEQLQGVPVAAGAWEGHVLPARVRDYDPSMLDMLCLSGRVVWVRAARRGGGGAGPVRTTPVLLAPRDSVHLWVGEELPDAEGLSRDAAKLRRVFVERGASFFPEAARVSGLLASQAETALAELVAAGHVVSDGFAGLRALLAPASLKRRGRRGRAPAPTVAEGGRWALAPVAPPPSPAAAELAELYGVDHRTREIVDRLLARYGVLFKAALARESGLPPWRDMLRVLRRMEARGEVRGGRFVQGFAGEQFATVGVVNALRRFREPAEQPVILSLSAVDPANPLGGVLRGARVGNLTGNRVLLVDGEAVAVMDGSEVRFVADVASESRWELETALVRVATPASVRRYLGNGPATTPRTAS